MSNQLEEYDIFLSLIKNDNRCSFLIEFPLKTLEKLSRKFQEAEHHAILSLQTKEKDMKEARGIQYYQFFAEEFLKNFKLGCFYVHLEILETKLLKKEEIEIYKLYEDIGDPKTLDLLKYREYLFQYFTSYFQDFLNDFLKVDYKHRFTTYTLTSDTMPLVEKIEIEFNQNLQLIKLFSIEAQYYFWNTYTNAFKKYSSVFENKYPESKQSVEQDIFAKEKAHFEVIQLLLLLLRCIMLDSLDCIFSNDDIDIFREHLITIRKAYWTMNT